MTGMPDDRRPSHAVILLFTVNTLLRCVRGDGDSSANEAEPSSCLTLGLLSFPHRGLTEKTVCEMQRDRRQDLLKTETKHQQIKALL
ncbi:uncharacterized protein [Hoplias malabaricus]|uniref:uncharacterized protein isoform X3 n=1 Tax=Hoplias malabaricus TaxID=27720 RepID=UPI003461AD87